jgi:hypothetical protein
MCGRRHERTEASQPTRTVRSADPGTAAIATSVMNEVANIARDLTAQPTDGAAHRGAAGSAKASAAKRAAAEAAASAVVSVAKPAGAALLVGSANARAAGSARDSAVGSARRNAAGSTSGVGAVRQSVATGVTGVVGQERTGRGIRRPHSVVLGGRTPTAASGGVRSGKTAVVVTETRPASGVTLRTVVTESVRTGTVGGRTVAVSGARSATGSVLVDTNRSIAAPGGEHTTGAGADMTTDGRT